MYNRYIPSADGTYHCEAVGENAQHTESNTYAKNLIRDKPRQLFPFPSLDSCDLLVLAVLFLVFQSSEEEDRMPLLITLAAFLLLN